MVNFIPGKVANSRPSDRTINYELFVEIAPHIALQKEAVYKIISLFRRHGRQYNNSQSSPLEKGLASAPTMLTFSYLLFDYPLCRPTLDPD